MYWKKLLRKICVLDDACNTILENADEIRPEHLAQAINYRSLDRDNWEK